MKSIDGTRVRCENSNCSLWSMSAVLAKKLNEHAEKIKGREVRLRKKVC